MPAPVDMVRIPAAALAAVLFLAPAAAEAAKRDVKRGQTVLDRQKERQGGSRFRPLGIRFGMFRFYPAQIVRAGFTDNLYASDTDEEWDWITTVDSRATVRSLWKRHAVRAQVDGQWVKHFRARDDDRLQGGVSADGRLDVTEALDLALGGAFRIEHQDRGHPNTVAGKSPTRHDTARLHSAVSWRPGRFSVDLGAEARLLDYKDVDLTILPGDRINNDDRDRLELEASLRAGFEYLTGVEAFARAAGRVNRYRVEAGEDDNGEDRDSRGGDLVLGTELDFTGVTTGEAFAGWMARDVDDPGLEDLSLPTAGLALRWNATNLTTLEADVTRQVEETTKRGSPGYVSTTFGVGLEHEFRRNLVATMRFSYRADRYEGLGRVDRIHVLRAGVDWRLSRHFGGGIEYSYRKKDSNLPGGEFDRNALTFRISARL